ncbi:copper resistance D family protein [Microbacterium sp. NIBRBAC000506063]|uniref:copper resistance D family protein n=1 Tax=Microbacterium sp. NIBRBAC000506063 TaxID=2734618 RepID=UPI001BB801A9|nr:CopD family protein [Microbacterium sp. NIBRBAC000506063]QTV80406.1 CopD family protein [Microbacterium sp. NIBRBAC000506063]
MLARFSTVAAGVLVALVVTGTVLAWRIAGSWEVLFDSSYGWLLLAKIAVALVAVVIAAANRFIVLPQIAVATRRKDKRGGAAILTRYVAAEAAALVIVLLITGFLVETSPQRDESSGSRGVAVESVSLGDIEARATLEPALEGPATVLVELFDSAGAPTEGMDTPRVRLSSGDIDLGSVEMTSIAPGTYSATVVLPARAHGRPRSHCGSESSTTPSASPSSRSGRAESLRLTPEGDSAQNHRERVHRYELRSARCSAAERSPSTMPRSVRSSRPPSCAARLADCGRSSRCPSRSCCSSAAPWSRPRQSRHRSRRPRAGPGSCAPSTTPSSGGSRRTPAPRSSSSPPATRSSGASIRRGKGTI